MLVITRHIYAVVNTYIMHLRNLHVYTDDNLHSYATERCTPDERHPLLRTVSGLFDPRGGRLAGHIARGTRAMSSTQRTLSRLFE
jgi:hypothetical protein